MVFTNIGKSGTAKSWVLGSYATPSYMAVGSGSGAIVGTTSGLLKEHIRNILSSSNGSTAQAVTHTGDFGAQTLSGTFVSEFGVFISSSGGQAWSVDGIGSIVFDGTSELQIQFNWITY